MPLIMIEYQAYQTDQSAKYCQDGELNRAKAGVDHRRRSKTDLDRAIDKSKSTESYLH